MESTRTARLVTGLVLLAALLVADSAFRVGTPALGEETSRAKAVAAARRIDSALGIPAGEAAPRAEDGEFLRRVHLDLVGRPPTLAETRAFLESESAGKRARVIDELLDSPAFADLAARRLSEVLFGDYRRLRLRGDGATLEPTSTVRAWTEFRRWLAARIEDGTPWPEIVTRLVASSGRLAEEPALLYQGSFFAGGQSHLNAADRVSTQLLGIQISCARCHDHPFDRWTQEDYYGLAAFAVRLRVRPEEREGDRCRDLTLFEADDGEVVMPGTKRRMPPRFLGDRRGAGNGRRMIALGGFLVGPGGSQLSRNAVNRTWAYLLGRGFVEPLHGFGRRNKPVASSAFETAVREFTRNGHSLKFLHRAIANTEAYQRSSRGGGQRPFARQAVRELTGQQLLLSLVNACMSLERPADLSDPIVSRQWEKFLGRVGRLFPSGAAFTEVTPLPGNAREKLLLRNGPLVHALAGTYQGITGHVMDLDAAPDRIETIFLSVLSRKPTYPELRRLTEFVLEAGDGKDAYEDVIWALLNSAEFTTRH